MSLLIFTVLVFCQRITKEDLKIKLHVYEHRQGIGMAMFKPKMNPEYSHVHSENFDLFLSPNVGRLKDIFSKCKWFKISLLIRVFCLWKNVSVSFSDKYLDECDFKTKINLADFGTNDGKNIFPFLRIMIGRIQIFNE